MRGQWMRYNSTTPMIMLVKPANRSWRSSICAIMMSALRIPDGLRNGKIPSITSMSARAARMLCHIEWYYTLKGSHCACITRMNCLGLSLLYSRVFFTALIQTPSSSTNRIGAWFRPYFKYLKNSIFGSTTNTSPLSEKECLYALKLR